MKKLLSVFFVLVVVMGSTSLHAQNFFLTDDDEREIPLFPAGSKEGVSFPDLARRFFFL